MNPKKNSLPLLFLFSFAAIFLYSYHYHFSQPHFPNYPSNSKTTLNPNFTFTIKLLTFNRFPSLRRCLLSIAAASYPSSDVIHLHIFIDHFKNATSADEDLKMSREILKFVDGFEWRHGEKVVHYRSGNAGLQAQWIEAWWPNGMDDFAFVVEDDLELSKFWYLFMKGLVLKYYYEEESWRKGVYGVSLQRPRFVAGKHGNKLQVDDETRLFLYQMVGTWGQLLFPKPWKEFRLWYDEHKAKGIKPILQGMVTTGWYKKIGEKIWTPWFIKFIHSRGYYNIYTNFQQERALSTSHRDAGVNYGKTAGPDSKLLDESSLDFNLYEFPPLKNLKWYDFCFSKVHPWRIIKSYKELATLINSMQKQKPIIIVSLYKTTEKNSKNLICHFERLNIQNIILIGEKIELLHEFARRGYPVIGSDQLVGEKFEDELMKEMSMKAQLIKKCIEMGYDCWMMDGNIVPYTNFFSELPNPAYTFSVAKNLELLFVRGSTASLKNWVNDVASKVKRIAHLDGKNFVHFATIVLEDSGAAKVWRFDDSMFGEKIIDGTTDAKSQARGKKFVYWSDARMDSVQMNLQKLDMWLIDSDMSCISVVCHQ